ncbi:hypothetical protein [Catenulispora acidiphila]|nr:hypothetical protein [Catenulispora acidiphila]
MATPPPQTPDTGHHKEHNKWLFIGGIAVFVIAAIVAMVVFSQHQNDEQARAKAKELQTLMVAAGYPLPDEETVVALLGTSGGAVCKDPTGALSKAQWLDNMSNGAAGPGMRPVIADRKAVAAEALVIKVYCPQHLDAFQDNVDDLKTGTTVRR